MMAFFFEGFDWDHGNIRKCRSHGVPRATIEGALTHQARVLQPDTKHSRIEDRYIAVCRTPDGRDLFVAFTFRVVDGRTLLRPITARHMHKREVERYGQARTAIEDG